MLRHIVHIWNCFLSSPKSHSVLSVLAFAERGPPIIPNVTCCSNQPWQSNITPTSYHLAYYDSCNGLSHHLPYIMNSMKLDIPLHFISWKKTPNDAVTQQCQSQFTPKMKANAVPRLLSSLVWIDQYNECNGMTSFMEFMYYSVKFKTMMH